MSAHTPGPWVVSSEVSGWANIDAPNEASSWYQLAKVAVKLDRQHSEEGMANAQLIAAAPDLLEALEKAVKRQGFTNEELINARAAIAKAKGGTP